MVRALRYSGFPKGEAMISQSGTIRMPSHETGSLHEGLCLWWVIEDRMKAPWISIPYLCNSSRLWKGPTIGEAKRDKLQRVFDTISGGIQAPTMLM